MAPSSGTLSRLDELIRPSLLEGRGEWHRFLLWSTVVVAVGVALEVWEIFHDVKEEIDHNRGIIRSRPLMLSDEGIPISEHRRTWMKTLGAIGWILVVLGVAGEFRFDSIISDFDNGIRLIDDSLLAAARSESTDANIAAALATQEAGRADDRTLREINARLALERDFIWRGPRDIPILAAQGTFDNKLRPFPGQRFRTFLCGRDLGFTGFGAPSGVVVSSGGASAADVVITEDALSKVLIHAGWKRSPEQRGVYLILPTVSCTSVGPSVHSGAPRRTIKAAKSLASLLYELLRERDTAIVPTTPDGWIPPESQLPDDVVEIQVGSHAAHPFDVR
jgi:hypothetical protein